jgi:hypothetical protein
MFPCSARAPRVAPAPPGTSLIPPTPTPSPGGLLITAIYWWLNRSVVPKIQKREAKKKKKAKMSVGESFAFLANSSYIRDMATLVGRRRAREPGAPRRARPLPEPEPPVLWPYSSHSEPPTQPSPSRSSPTVSPSTWWR